MQSSTYRLVLVTTCVALSLAFTALVLIYSTHHGKLAIPPDYDDSHSMVEGALRLLTLQQRGLAAAWAEYLDRPPHSFLHYYFAAASYALFGIAAPVVYWTSSLFVLVALLGLVVLLDVVQPLRIFILAIAFLATPVMFNLVFDFRSECALAALLFAASCAAIRAAWATSHPYRWSAATGVLIALALAIKPAMFPYTLGMAIGANSLMVPAIVLFGSERWPVALRSTLIIWTLAIAPVAFHYAWNWRPIFGYILNIAFESDYYQQGGGVADQLLFHLTGFPGRFQLGSLVWPLTGIALLGNVAACWPPRDGAAGFRRRLFSCSFLTVVAYLGVAVNGMNQNYFGMSFHLLLIASAVLAIAQFARLLPQTWGTLLCAAALLAVLAQWRVPITQDYVERTREVGGDVALNWRREGPTRMFEVLRPYWRADDPPTVWFAAYGWTDANTTGWEAVRRGVRWKLWNYYDLPPSSGAPVPDRADLIVVPEPGLMGMLDVPCNEKLPDIEQALTGDPAFEWVDSIVDPNGRRLRVYRRHRIPDDKPAS